jgi:hypothetical protein
MLSCGDQRPQDTTHCRAQIWNCVLLPADRHRAMQRSMQLRLSDMRNRGGATVFTGRAVSSPLPATGAARAGLP